MRFLILAFMVSMEIAGCDSPTPTYKANKSENKEQDSVQLSSNTEPKQEYPFLSQENSITHLNQVYKVHLWERKNRDESLYILGPGNDTIHREEHTGARFKLIDFNLDGFTDILIEYRTNVPNVAALWQFDPDLLTFRRVDNLESYPTAQALKNTGYYFSYERAGCSDYNWESKLFYIKDFHTVAIGLIRGMGCEDSLTKRGIFIYQVREDQKTLVETLPIALIDQDKDSKWGIIEKYWTRHYQKFGRQTGQEVNN